MGSSNGGVSSSPLIRGDPHGAVMEFILDGEEAQVIRAAKEKEGERRRWRRRKRKKDDDADFIGIIALIAVIVHIILVEEEDRG